MNFCACSPNFVSSGPRLHQILQFLVSQSSSGSKPVSLFPNPKRPSVVLCITRIPVANSINRCYAIRLRRIAAIHKNKWSQIFQHTQSTSGILPLGPSFATFVRPPFPLFQIPVPCRTSGICRCRCRGAGQLTSTSRTVTPPIFATLNLERESKGY
jgi:hypothetical protein